jgi:hypothetical protein
MTTWRRILDKASKSCAADPGGRAAISSLLVCRFRSRADLDLEVVARLRPRLAHGRLYERRLWFRNVSKVRLNAYDNVAIDSHAIQCAAKRISHDLEQCSYLASPVHCARWITKCAGDNEMTFHCFIDFLRFTIRMYIRKA